MFGLFVSWEVDNYYQMYTKRFIYKWEYNDKG